MYGTKKGRKRKTETNQETEGQERCSSGGTDYRVDAGS